MSFHIHRILSQQHLSQPQPHGVCARSSDAGLRNPRIDVGFADACQAFVGVIATTRSSRAELVEPVWRRTYAPIRLPLPYHVWRRRPEEGLLASQLHRWVPRRDSLDLASAPPQMV